MYVWEGDDGCRHGEGGGGLEDLGKESPPPEHFPRSCEVIQRHPCRYVVVRSDAGKIFT